MILIAGLGNPGKEYEKTRHNYGFMVIDRLAERNGFPLFKLSKEYRALISMEGDIILAKPQTYMNESGKAIKSIASYYKIEPKDIIVIHDDADIPLGEIKVAEGRSSAGHKGVQSTIDELGTKDFQRIRMGMDSEDPSYKEPVERGEGLEAVVLKNFSKDEEPVVSKAIEEAAAKAEELWKR
jgi:peptidyl-tRNA hydrolase, PTH1 family